MKHERYRVQPGTEVDLSAWDTDGAGATKLDKAGGLVELAKLNEKVSWLQQLLYAQGVHRVLVVLQGMDTSGKDGTIKHVFRLVNPQGVQVTSFKRPTETELAHDYLWRVHQHVPWNGRIQIFNRSHYEDVLVVRVHDLAPKHVWSKRYEHIVNFEQLLVDEGTVVLKFFLHISKGEQKKRLTERLENPDKHWKFEMGDLEERKLWRAYQEAYGDAIGRTSTADAPWYIVPSDRKWFRNLVIGSVLIEALEDLKMKFPAAPDLAGIRVD